MNKRLFSTFTLAVLSVMFTFAQQRPTAAAVFKTMPDSLLPVLSLTNRLDMIDFMEAQMKAEVTNLLEGSSEMTALTDDSLSIRMDTVLRVDMVLRTEADSTIICLRRTYKINECQMEIVENDYTTTWHPLAKSRVSSSLLRRDEQLLDRQRQF